MQERSVQYIYFDIKSISSSVLENDQNSNNSKSKKLQSNINIHRLHNNQKTGEGVKQKTKNHIVNAKQNHKKGPCGHARAQTQVVDTDINSLYGYDTMISSLIDGYTKENIDLITFDKFIFFLSLQFRCNINFSLFVFVIYFLEFLSLLKFFF